MGGIPDRIWNFTLEHEGGYCFDKYDAGGETKYGVSRAYLDDLSRSRPSVLRDVLGTDVVTRQIIKELTKEQAKALFAYSFWNPLQCGDYHPAVALCAFDMGVNHGVGNATRLLQRACNRVLPTLLAVDGKIGPKTKAALRQMATTARIGAIAAARQDFYDSIVQNRPNQKVFLKGWTRRCTDMLNTAVSWVEEDG